MPISRVTLDRVARTEFGTLWLLIPFAVVIGLFAAAVLPKDRNAASFFAGVGLLALTTLTWAWFERRAAHRMLELLHANQALPTDTRPERLLRQYTVSVGFLVLGATFQTGFHARHRPVLATLTTLLFGWWTFPWGPVRTVRTIASNLRGGTARSEAHLLAELRLRTPPPPPWWRRLLALDSRNPVRIASNLATLGMAMVVVVLVVKVFVRTILGEAPSP